MIPFELKKKLQNSLSKKKLKNAGNIFPWIQHKLPIVAIKRTKSKYEYKYTDILLPKSAK